MYEKYDREYAELSDRVKTMAMMCVRNTMLENIHAGRCPVTKTGDYSDVFVVGADGQRIPWKEVSHFDDDEMRKLMREIVNRLYTFHELEQDPVFQARMGLWSRSASRWDDPKLDPDLTYRMDVDPRLVAVSDS